jgi:hypothetical protein
VVISLPKSVIVGDATSEFAESDEQKDVSEGFGERAGGDVGGDMSESAMDLTSTIEVG